MKCRSCGASNALRRETRKSFAQKKLFPLFGFFPWECAICRKVRLYHQEFKLRQEDAPRNVEEAQAEAEEWQRNVIR